MKIKRVKYLNELEEIEEAKVLVKEHNSCAIALLLLPARKHGDCPCITMAIYDEDKGLYTDIADSSWVNIGSLKEIETMIKILEQEADKRRKYRKRSSRSGFLG